MNRRNTKKIRVGSVEIGGGSPIAVQSMTNTIPGMLKQPFSRFWAGESRRDIVRISFSIKNADTQRD